MRAKHKAGLDFAREIVRAKFRWQHPLYLIHALTARCNARCGFCAWDFYDESDQLSTEQILRLHREAREAGFVGMTLWGGEPLLHRDSAAIFEHAHDLGFATNLVTNGFLLEKKMDEVVEHIGRIGISVDHPSAKHDELRQIKGLFARIVESTKAIRKRDPSKRIVFICTLQKGNTDAETVREMAELLKSLDVVGVFNALRLDAASEDAGEIDLARYNPTQAELSRAFGQLAELKRAGYPILNSFTHLEKLRRGHPDYRCHWPKFMLPIEANGDVVDCMHWGSRPIDNVKEKPFSEILASPRLRELAGKQGEACHKCVSLHRVEISEIWDGNLEPLVSWWDNLGRSRSDSPWARPLEPVRRMARSAFPR